MFNSDPELHSNWYGPPHLVSTNLPLSTMVSRARTFLVTGSAQFSHWSSTEGKLLAKGKPTGALPSMRERQMNYKLVEGSKYATEADKIAKGVVPE